jgi:hypothetical protein
MLRAVADGVWIVDFPARIAGMPLGARMTVVATARGTLLISPVPLEASDVAAIARLGDVAAIVAPNLFHYRHVPDVKARFPRARVLAAPGLRAKRPALPIDAELDAAALAGTGLETHAVGGIPRLGEIAFFHPASRTLVLTDLLFHFPDPRSWLLRAYLRSRAPRVSPLLRAMVRDRAALARSRDALVAWDPARVIVAHGDLIASDAREALRAALTRV